jgi:protein-disulfide isomerase
MILLLLAAEVLAVVNGKPITRQEVEAALTDRARQEYTQARDDLQDFEHAAVRDYLGRQALEAEAKRQKTTTDAIYEGVLAADFDKLDANLRNRIQQQRERIYNAERATLEELVRKRLLEDAAKAKGMTVEELNRSLENQAPPVTKADLDFIKAYETSKQSVSATVPPGEQRLAAAIRAARVEEMKSALIAGGKVETRLEPPRVPVSTAGAPLAGSATAPVKVVVFTDFECPYCREAELTLRRLRQQYGDKLALCFRNYPLPNHLYARPAAIAAVCAGEQGKYFPMHELLFGHQQDLPHADYDAWAEQIGLDRAKFDACRASDQASKRVDQDIRDGVAAGVAGTPTFFVNGRLVNDDQALPGVIADEMAKAK